MARAYQGPLKGIRYSGLTNTWRFVADINDNRLAFCACSIIDSVYVFGGCLKGNVNSCIKLNTTTCTWIEIAEMHETKQVASCAVFGGRVVVSGGYNDQMLRSVHAYDHLIRSQSCRT